MEENKKVNPYVIGGSALAALTMAFLLARGLNGNATSESDNDAAKGTASTNEPARGAPQAATPALAKDVRFKVPVSTMQPFEGPADALVTAVEWCDLRGAVCRESDQVLDQVMKEYAGKLRRVYRLVPDSSRPEEAKLIHQFARAAYEDGKNSARFVKVRKQLLAVPDGEPIGEAQLRPIAAIVGMRYDAIAPQIRSGTYLTAPALDSGFAARFGMKQIPGIYVNGRPVEPGNSASELKTALKILIEEELVNAQNALAQGVEKALLYDALVENGLWSTDDNPAARQASATRPKRQLPAMGQSAAAAKP